jgi:hypothetical protein
MALMLPALIVAATMPALVQGSLAEQPIGPQSPAAEESTGPLDERDSVRVLRAARRAQDDFEVFRRRHLPRQSTLAGRPCDVIIGRYCHWQQVAGHGPPPESPEVVERRDRLLDALDSLRTLLPGDEWILAQKFRYLREAGRDGEADRMTTDCAAHRTPTAIRRWCRALTGYAAQSRGDYARADSIFATALAEMPEAERCAWQDLTMLLDGKAAGQYRRLGCAARDSMAAHIWRLAQPLYLTGVNDLRTEFLARVTRMRIERNSRTPISPDQRADDRESLLRYGDALWYSQDDARLDGPPTVASHRRAPAFNFFPEWRALASPEMLRVDDWEFSSLTAHTTYAPRYTYSFVPLLDHQVAVFRRGDSAVVVAAFDAAAAGLSTGDNADAGLFAATVENGSMSPPMAGVVERATPTATVATVSVPWAPMIVSLEVLDRANRSAARARYSVTLPTPGARLSISDLLLYSPRDSAPASLLEAVPRALPTVRVTSSHLGLYWETYGVRPKGEQVDVAVLVEPAERGWVRRAFDRLRFKSKARSVSVRWRDVTKPENGVAPRSLTVDLSPLDPGRYRVRVVLTSAPQTPIVAERYIEIIQ